VLVKRADARDAEKIFKFIQKALLIIARKINCRRSHGCTLSDERTIADGGTETTQYIATRQTEAMSWQR
jgi:hypothetical protein